MNRLKVSIVIPVYNVESYIERCIQSVISQTYTGEMECILVDDCGKDRSVKVAEQFIENWRLKNGDRKLKFSIVHHERNRGLSAARNTGLDAATGDYIYFLDSDDEMPLNAIELMERAVEKHLNIDMVQGALQSIPHSSYYDMDCFKVNQYVDDNLWIRRHFYCIGKTIPVNGVNKLINVNFLRKHQLYFKEEILQEDEHWMFYMVKHLSSMAFVFEPTYIRYMNEGSIMATSTIHRDAPHWAIIVKDWSDHVDDVETKWQLQKILSCYGGNMAYIALSRSDDRKFLNKITAMLKQEKQYRSIMLLYLWRMVKPIKNIRRILRYSCEAIK